MSYKRNKKCWWANVHLRYIIAIMVLCSIIYYLPVIGGLFGWTSLENSLSSLHDFYGIDFLGLVFFAPVVYTAYVLGVIPAVLAALIAMLILLPHAILIDTYPNALFKPTAFVIILSAVGAAVAMLQKSEQQHHQRMKEMKCLYDIGKAAEESGSVVEFLPKVVGLIPQAMQSPEETNVRITFHDQVFKSPDFHKSPSKISENLVVGGEALGLVEIYSSRDNPYLKKRNHLTKTLVERIGGAIRQVELEQSLQGYYEQLEDEVDIRTKDLEKVQEKLIRSERLAAVGELASGVGHELRNPLNVIRNCAYLLNMALTDKGDEEAANTLKVLDKQVDITNKIVTDLLDFTRITPPSPDRVDLNTLINESLSWITVPEQVTVNNNVNGHPMQVRTDAEQISRVFTNIISNAIQAMNAKDGKLDIDTGAEDDGFVWIKFQDNGCGIPEDNMDKIFEPLFTTKPKGIGLGLAITKRLVEQNGGKIEIASQTGQGTTFTVKLPLEKRR
ncbi:MAG: GHKL domain-containing protein [Dehalococcoidales bacterium]|nr:GHKL domain-containing protein [Dehalococcoidales bacterium]